MRLSKIVNALKESKVLYEGDWEREISSLSADSKNEVCEGLFFCLNGEHFDGHDYAAEAVKNGCIAVVCERRLSIDVPQIVVLDSRMALGVIASVFYGEPSQKMKVIGVTGTNGKTTTSYMLASILENSGKKVGVIGTLGITYGGMCFPCDLTTPDPIVLQKTFAKMAFAGIEYVVMEVSAHALYYNKVAGVCYSACIFTNLTQDHLDFFKEMAAYKNAKAKLFDEDFCPVAILNGDDEVGREFATLRSKGKTVFYGLHTPADAFAVITEEGLKRTDCVLNINDKLFRVALALTGRHNIYNALAAAACACELGVFSVTEGLNALKVVEGRLEWIATWQNSEIYLDFAHTPDGLEKSLNALKKHCRGRLICLFGCGGNRDKGKRPLMGECVAKNADFAIITSDNPRYEDQLDIISDIEKGFRRFSARYVVVPDRKRAISYALDFLQKGDILLLAGKGGEKTQEIMGIKYPFNEHDIVKDLLEKKGNNPFS